MPVARAMFARAGDSGTGVAKSREEVEWGGRGQQYWQGGAGVDRLGLEWGKISCASMHYVYPLSASRVFPPTSAYICATSITDTGLHWSIPGPGAYSKAKGQMSPYLKMTSSGQDSPTGHSTACTVPLHYPKKIKSLELSSPACCRRTGCDEHAIKQDHGQAEREWKEGLQPTIMLDPSLCLRTAQSRQKLLQSAQT